MQGFAVQPTTAIFNRLTRRHARWMELLQEYDFHFKYKQGIDHIVPDALSRRPGHRYPDLMELFVSFDVRDQLVQDYIKDPRLGPIYKDCQEGKVDNGYSTAYNTLFD